MQRRRFLRVAGGVSAGGFAGCTGEDGEGVTDPPEFEGGVGTDAGEDDPGETESALSGTGAGYEPESDLREHELVVEDGTATVEGVLENDSGERLGVVEVTVDVYDADGDGLGSYGTLTIHLDDGESWAFEVEVAEDPGDVDDYDVYVVDTVAGDDWREHEDDIVVRDHEMVADGGDLAVTGVAENASGGPLEFVRLLVAVYDEDGHRIGTDDAVMIDLPDGETRSFEVEVSEEPGEVDDYDVKVIQVEE